MKCSSRILTSVRFCGLLLRTGFYPQMNPVENHRLFHWFRGPGCERKSLPQKNRSPKARDRNHQTCHNPTYIWVTEYHALRPWEGLVIPYRGTNRFGVYFTSGENTFLLHPNKVGRWAWMAYNHWLGRYLALILPL